MAYLETILDGMTVENPADVSALELRLDTLRTEALRGRESLTLMERVIEDEWQDELA